MEQENLRHSFTKAVEERPKEWSSGFMEYYNNQGYGKNHGAEGLEGTLAVLGARSKLESKIFDTLKMDKVNINNTQFDLASLRTKVKDIVESM
ncbi:hypothetical protein [Peribacillus sp. SCS-155]|uniref:hypothetical protein n=1 Tax=Peribacillus sedimenti TaxID=3115297 RepID=UPI00390618BD